jgi:hypothetical protein
VAQPGAQEGAQAELLQQVAATPVLADQHVVGGEGGDGPAAKPGLHLVDGRHAQQCAIHVEQRDAFPLPQFVLRVLALHVEEFLGEDPDVIPLRRRQRAGGVHGGLDAISSHGASLPCRIPAHGNPRVQ